MTVTEHKPGTPCWVDLAATDVEAATDFYTQLFGWTAQPAPDYTMFLNDGVPVAGLGSVTGPDQPSIWSWYAATTDADETARKVEAAGGKVMVAPFDVLDAGRMAVFLDPAGTAFSVWQAGAMPGAGVLREPVSLSWVELMTRHTATATEFYPAVFGWTATHTTEPAPYTRFGVDGVVFGGMMSIDGPEWPPTLPDHWMVYFEVADPDDTCTRLKHLGGTVSVPATTVPGVGRFAILGDPFGAYFSIIKRA